MYQRPIKKYATRILSDPSPTTLNSCSVFSIKHLAFSTAIGKTSEVGGISQSVSLSHCYRKSSSEITEVLRFTSINDRSYLVSTGYLLVNYLLPSRRDFINCDRSNSMGQDQYTDNRPAVWEKRAIPLFWSLLPKLGSSNVAEQIDAITAISPLLKNYQVVVLGDA